jgi:hypothetical protein
MLPVWLSGYQASEAMATGRSASGAWPEANCFSHGFPGFVEENYLLGGINGMEKIAAANKKDRVLPPAGIPGPAADRAGAIRVSVGSGRK